MIPVVLRYTLSGKLKPVDQRLFVSIVQGEGRVWVSSLAPGEQSIGREFGIRPAATIGKSRRMPATNDVIQSLLGAEYVNCLYRGQVPVRGRAKDGYHYYSSLLGTDTVVECSSCGLRDILEERPSTFAARQRDTDQQITHPKSGTSWSTTLDVACWTENIGFNFDTGYFMLDESPGGLAIVLERLRPLAPKLIARNYEFTTNPFSAITVCQLERPIAHYVS